MASGLPDHIAHAAHGVDELDAEGLVDLAAEKADVHIHRVGLSHKVKAPYAVQQGLPGEYPALVLQQLVQKIKFFLGQ